MAELTKHDVLQALRDIEQVPSTRAGKKRSIYESADGPFYLDYSSFRPRGNTALLDAMGRTIVSLGNDLSTLAESDRPSKVIVMILTDGLENASREYRQEQIAAMVTHQKEQYNWDFVFLGSNQDAVLTASRYGIKRDSALTYQPTQQGMRRVMAAATRSLASRRVGASGAFTKRDRQ